MKLKSAEITLDDDLEEGEFIAYASTFTDKDSYGDVMQKGSFDKTVEEWNAGAKGTLPLLFNHDFKNPMHYIGEVKSLAPDERGLKVHAKFDLDTPRGAQVHKLVKGRRITQLSFAYDEISSHPVKGDPTFGDYKSLDEVAIHEISITPYGANRGTEVLAVKSAIAALKNADADQITDPVVIAELQVALRKAADALNIPVLSGTDTEVKRQDRPGVDASLPDLVRKFKLAHLPREFHPSR